MPKIRPIQTSFESGMIKPSLYGRIDSDVYRTGLALSENFGLDIRGSAVSRYGSKHQFRFANHSDARLFAFTVNSLTTALCIFLESRIQIRNILNATTPTIQLIKNPSFQEDGLNWTTATGAGASVTYDGHNAFLSSSLSAGAYAQISQQITVTQEEDYILDIHGYEMGAISAEFEIKIGTSVYDGSVLSASVYNQSHYFNTVHLNVGTYYITLRQLGGISYETMLTNVLLRYSDVVSNYVKNPGFLDAGTDWSIVEGAGGEGVASFPVPYCVMTNGPDSDDWVEIRQTLTFDATGSYKFTIQGANLGSTSANLSGFVVKIGTTAGGSEVYTTTLYNQTYLSLDITIPSTTIYISFRQVAGSTQHTSTIHAIFFGVPEFTEIKLDTTTTYTISELHDMHIVMAPEGDLAFITSIGRTPARIAYDRATTAFTFTQDLSGIFKFGTIASNTPGFPSEWVTSPPSTVAFHQGRSWWGGCVDYPDTFWASASGDYYLLGDGSATAADEPMKFTTSHHGLIKWMIGGKELVIGTEIDEYTVWSGKTTDSLIAPGQINVVKQTAHGSSSIQPVEIGNAIVFASSNRQIVRALWYNWQEDGWVSQDLTFAAGAPEVPSEVIEISTTKTPQDMLFATLINGHIATCVYFRDGAAQQASVGWFRITTQGNQKSTVLFEQRTHTEFWTAVQRVINGVSYIHVDSSVITQDATFEQSIFRTDSSVEIQVGTPVKVITGLDHLEGEWVRPLIDNAVHPLVQVSGGQVTLEWAGSVLQAGLPYTCTLLTLPAATDERFNTNMGDAKRWTKIYVYLLSSIYPLINGIRPATRFPASHMDETQPDVTGIVEVSNLGFNKLESISIVNDLPRNVQILGIFGELAQHSL